MKLILVLIGLIFISSCRSLTDNSELFYLSHNYESYTSAYIDTIRTIQSVEKEDSVYRIKYKVYELDRIDTITYILKEDSSFQPEYQWNGDCGSAFILADVEEFNLNFKSYKVYKYASNPRAIDGCVTHFWTPGLGVFLVRSTAWRKMRILYSTNEEINKEITSLCRLIWQYPEFYFGCNEKMEIIPNQIFEEFSDWYMNERLKPFEE
ncbi:hypothetical protein [Marinilabilia rubra]|uniref:Lipoprotein n=1 Tax=Marinilabilia rubra TaxID=2162893 RepID=A0A2U2B5B9_9BACT|nr:hypothetical protein [Marinilabilia rubra]PWD98232.1 hypothetical protein DDZ16_16490 [Marinilabilia rubra]